MATHPNPGLKGPSKITPDSRWRRFSPREQHHPPVSTLILPSPCLGPLFEVKGYKKLTLNLRETKLNSCDFLSPLFEQHLITRHGEVPRMMFTSPISASSSPNGKFASLVGLAELASEEVGPLVHSPSYVFARPSFRSPGKLAASSVFASWPHGKFVSSFVLTPLFFKVGGVVGWIPRDPVESP